MRNFIAVLAVFVSMVGNTSAGMLDSLMGKNSYEFMGVKLGDSLSSLRSWAKSRGYNLTLTFDQFKASLSRGELNGKNFKACFTDNDVDGVKGYMIFTCLDDANDRVFDRMKAIVFNDKLFGLEVNVFDGNMEKVFSGLTSKYGENFSPMQDRRDITPQDPYLSKACNASDCQIVFWSNKALDQDARLIAIKPGKVSGKAVKLILTDFKTLEPWQTAVMVQRKSQGRKAASDLGL